MYNTSSIRGLSSISIKVSLFGNLKMKPKGCRNGQRGIATVNYFAKSWQLKHN